MKSKCWDIIEGKLRLTMQIISPKFQIICPFLTFQRCNLPQKLKLFLGILSIELNFWINYTKIKFSSYVSIISSDFLIKCFKKGKVHHDIRQIFVLPDLCKKFYIQMKITLLVLVKCNWKYQQNKKYKAYIFEQSSAIITFSVSRQDTKSLLLLTCP